jgi:hypothetical protein
MSMPAFTAEASLYKSRTQYNMSVSRFLAAKADIQPQLRLRPPKDCIPGCVCVSRWEAHGLRPMRFVPQRILSEL